MPAITLIAALGENRVIGHNGGIPWRLPGEQAHFRATTMGHTLVMGRATFDSIGRALPGRRTIVVTRNPDWRQPGVETAASLPEALDDQGEVFIAGGGQIYAASLPLASRMILTLVHDSPVGDTFFPRWDLREWVEVERRPGEGYDVAVLVRLPILAAEKL